MKRLYDLLGVSSGAGEDEIKGAYRRAALRHHPDRGGDVRFMQEINKAYEILSDRAKRAAYADDGGEAVPGAVPVVVCACGCESCRDFTDHGCPPGFGGCSACPVCNPPSRRYAELMRGEFRRRWDRREAQEAGSVACRMRAQTRQALDSLLPTVLPQDNMLVEVRGLTAQPQYNGVRGHLLGVQERGRHAVELWYSGERKVLHVREENVVAVARDGGLVPDYANLVGEAVRLLAPLAPGASGAGAATQAACLHVGASPEELLQVAADCAKAIADRACIAPGEPLPPEMGRLLWTFGRSLRAFGDTKEADGLDSVGITVQRMACAVLQAAADTSDRVPGGDAEVASARACLEEMLRAAAERQLTEDVAEIGEAVRDCRDAQLELEIVRKLRGEQAEAGAPVVDEELDLRQAAAESKKESASQLIEQHYLGLSAVLCRAHDGDPFIEVAVASALRAVSPKSQGTQLVCKLLGAALLTLQQPAEALPALDELCWAALGEAEQKGVHSAAARLAARMAGRGRLRTLLGIAGADGPPAVSLTPPTVRLWPNLRTSNPNDRVFERIEHGLLAKWRASPTCEQARFTALSYLDMLRLAGRALEHIVCLQNAALWLHQALLVADGQPHAERYALKECALLLCRSAAALAREHGHHGLHLFVLRQAFALASKVVAFADLGDDSDLPIVERLAGEWLHATRLLPLGCPPSIMLCEAALLDLLLGALHVHYVDGLAEGAECQTHPAVPAPLTEYLRLEASLSGLGGFRRDKGRSCDAEAARRRAVFAALAHEGWTPQQVQHLHGAAYAGRGPSGWREGAAPPRALPPSGAAMVAKVKELLGQLKGRRLTTDRPPDLDRRLARATEEQCRAILLELAKDDSRCLRDVGETSSLEDTVGRLRAAFSARFSAAAAAAAPLPKVEAELRRLLESLAAMQSPRQAPAAPAGHSLRGLAVRPDGGIEVAVEQVQGGVPAALFWRLFGEVLRLPEDIGPLFFSLDHPRASRECGPMRHHVMQQQRYPDGLAGSAVVQLMHHCDYTMKELSTGVELNLGSFELQPAGRNLHACMPRYLVDLLLPIHEREGPGRSMHRLWLESGEAKFLRRDQGGSTEMCMTTPQIRVCAHPLEFDADGGYRDTLEDSPPGCPAAEFAKAMTLAMGNLGQSFPEFLWLAEVPKMQQVARELRAQGQYLERRCEVLGQVALQVLDDLRGQVGEWPHRVERYDEVLDALCRQNPHATRAQIQAHPVFEEAVREAPDRAAQRDNHTVHQLVDCLAKQMTEFAGHSVDTSRLDAGIRHWLSSGDRGQLAAEITMPVKQKRDRFLQDLARLTACGAPNGGPASDACLWVPAAFHINSQTLVYGGVDLGSPFHEDPQDPALLRLLGLGTFSYVTSKKYEEMSSRAQREEAGWQAGNIAWGIRDTTPMTFADLRSADPKLAKSLSYRGGYKPFGEAAKLFESIPRSVRAEGAQAVRAYLVDKDASHVIARAQGGPSTAENLVFEDRGLNRQRNYDAKSGSRPTPHMTAEELQAAHDAGFATHVKVGLKQAVRSAAKGAVTGGVGEGVLSVAEDGLAYRTGEIGGREYVRRVAKKTAVGVATGGAVAGLGALACTFVPAAAVVLGPVAVPLAVAGAVTTGYRLTKAAREHLKISR